MELERIGRGTWNADSATYYLLPNTCYQLPTTYHLPSAIIYQLLPAKPWERAPGPQGRAGPTWR